MLNGNERPRVPQRGAASEMHHTSSQQQSVPDPQVDVPMAGGASFASSEIDLAVIQSGSRVAEQQQVAHEHDVVVGDAQARQGPPEVVSSSGQQARPHGVLRRQKTHRMLQDDVRQRAEPVHAGDRLLRCYRRYLGVAPRGAMIDPIRATGSQRKKCGEMAPGKQELEAGGVEVESDVLSGGARGQTNTAAGKVGHAHWRSPQPYDQILDGLDWTARAYIYSRAALCPASRCKY